MNKFGQKAPLTEEEKTFLGFKRRRLIMFILIGVLVAIIILQVVLLLL